MNVMDFKALLYFALLLALRIPLAILAFFASLFFKDGHTRPSLFQRLTATVVKTSQSCVPLWMTRKLVSQFMNVTVSHEKQKYWVKKLDANNEQDGWEGYLIANGVEHSEIGRDADMIILYAHGGGFVCGDALTPLSMFIDWINEWKLSHGAKTQILSLEYGLSPENSFPVARDNMLACYQWLVNEKKISPSKIALAGDSAGGNLAVVTAIQLVNQLYANPPAALILLSPCLSGVANTESFVNNASYDTTDIGWFYHCLNAYLGDSNLLPSCPMISPLFESQLSGLPKVWACVGSYDIFLDDVISFIEKLMQSKVKAELVVEESNFHGYSLAKILSRHGAYDNSIKRIGKFLYV